MKIRTLAASVIATAFPLVLHAFPVSDQGNGTFKNPVMWADVPDLCMTRVGDTYYMVSTTMHLAYDWPDFMGYRFALFYYSTENLGGCVDFNYFRVSDKVATSSAVSK